MLAKRTWIPYKDFSRGPIFYIESHVHLQYGLSTICYEPAILHELVQEQALLDEAVGLLLEGLWSSRHKKQSILVEEALHGVPKSSQNGPKIIPKWSQNDPKWSQNCPKMVP